GLSAASGNCIEVFPTVLLGSEDDSTFGHPLQKIFARGRHRVVRRATAVPDFVRLAGREVGYVDRPGVRRIVEKKCGLISQCRSTYKCDLLSVRRPTRSRIAITRRDQIANCFRRRIVYTDKAVIAAAADKCDIASIRRPMRRSVCSARSKELCRLGLGLGKRGRPKLVVI